METDVLGCTINQPLARFVCCWVFLFFIYFFFHKLSKVLLSGAIDVLTHSASQIFPLGLFCICYRG